jgi:hypothetical protein
MSGLPPLPKIEGDIDLMLDVYTHSSLRMPETPMNDDYGDTPRLRELGQRVLELVVTYHLFNERPMLRQDEIQVGTHLSPIRNLRQLSHRRKGNTSSPILTLICG